jgi:hypothetical protein
MNGGGQPPGRPAGIDYSRWDNIQDDDEDVVAGTSAATNASQPMSAEQRELKRGDGVILQGLQRSRELNGMPASVVDILPDGNVRMSFVPIRKCIQRKYSYVQM